MSSVGIHPPKTPVTKGSIGIAKATTPNVCKMPGPPAPFVPSPLPNIAKSGMSPKGYSKTVKIESNPVAIRGATFKSMGDMASKGTGGGLISANTHGPAKFITPGSLTVKIEGKSVHLLGEPMLNNCGPSGNPPNTGATLCGVKQANQGGANPLKIDCKDGMKNGEPFSECEIEEICSKCADINRIAQGKTRSKLQRRDSTYEKRRRLGDNKCRSLKRAAAKGQAADLGFTGQSEKCKAGMKNKAENSDPLYDDFSPDHIHEIQLGGHPTANKNLRWMSSRINSWMGDKLQPPKSPESEYGFRTSGPGKHTGVKPDCCP